ncbi:MAG: Cys-tRNA(Pro)/Cys-tRNA(Cys) deacylase [Oceanospirillaceae bacterium]|jgi:Cys-tRNA(Pro)/Cys-tRNA(Cys) deacylase
MTPAINSAKKQKISHVIHEYTHDVKATSYGNEAAEKLAVEPKKIFKTLVVSLDNKNLAVAIIPVLEQLSMKRVAKALDVKKAVMADKAVVERTTGYVLGGVSPLGQKKLLLTVLDQSAESLDTLFVSAGKRGLEIELKPSDLIKLTRGKYAYISQTD